jgi:ribonucleoside-diphosphate reductase alpha chain
LAPTQRAKEIAVQLSGIGGRRSVGFGPNKILSLPDAVAMALSAHFGFKINGFLKSDSVQSNGNPNSNGVYNRKESYGNGHLEANENLVLVGDSLVPGATKEASLPNASTEEQLTLEDIKGVGDICPSCGASSLIYQEGCSKCQSCGHSEC